ncbi:MAG TPA: Rieske 2Fe-2S domain-containing protein [Gemmatimonadales bacterium]|nr:Rieske 2Fe-2S domain-containing protein [Gemmatimonadales bacterium]
MSDCTHCPGEDRRQFLKQVTAAVAAAMAALAATPREAAALPISLGRALSVLGQQLTYPVPTGDGATIDRDNEVILVRWKGEAYAVNLSCPHQNTALRWFDKDSRFQCPKHHSKYQPDGTFISGRATRNMDRFAIKKGPTGLVVNLDLLYRNDKQPAQWAAARVDL